MARPMAESCSLRASSTAICCDKAACTAQAPVGLGVVAMLAPLLACQFEGDDLGQLPALGASDSHGGRQLALSGPAPDAVPVHAIALGKVLVPQVALFDGGADSFRGGGDGSHVNSFYMAGRLGYHDGVKSTLTSISRPA